MTFRPRRDLPALAAGAYGLRYKVLAADSIHAAGGRYIVRGGEVDLLEGAEPEGRTVVLEFPTRQAALDWYHGDQYATARTVREGAARATMYVVDGYDDDV